MVHHMNMRVFLPLENMPNNLVLKAIGHLDY